MSAISTTEYAINLKRLADAVHKVHVAARLEIRGTGGVYLKNQHGDVVADTVDGVAKFLDDTVERYYSMDDEI